MAMLKAKKLKMTQVWKEEKVIPVTVLGIDLGKYDADVLKEGDKVQVTSRTRGRGFQGTVKRYSFAGGPKTHGQKNRMRAPGSIGSTAPQRVWPGRKMAGHMGTTNMTIKGLRVVTVDKENNLVMLKGAVPGMRGSEVRIKVK
jgi:large subunit ribosomal protein L3